MTISCTVDGDGIAEVVMDRPPVNALDRRRLVRARRHRCAALGDDPAVRVVVLRAEGRGFNAGVDIKEMQATEGFDALIGANRGCFAAFAAVYECAVPVIAAVNGFCLGGGIGLSATPTSSSPPTTPPSGCPRSTAARSAPPPTWPASCPQHKMRAMVYTGATATRGRAARTSARCCRSSRPTELRDAALERRPPDRRQEPDRDPRGQGVAQRHRPGRREAQLPLRAGLHVRAEPLRRVRRAPRRVRRASATPTPDRRGRRPCPTSA